MQWRMMPNDLPPWHAVYQQTRHWLKAGVFENMVRDLRMLMREINERMPQPRAAILDSRTLKSSPESGPGLCRTWQSVLQWRTLFPATLFGRKQQTDGP
jgi:transposase